MSYALHYGPGVERDMSRLPRTVLARVDRVILALADTLVRRTARNWRDS